MKKNLIECRACRKEIAKSASKCPHCGAAKTTGVRMILILVVGSIVALIAWVMWIGPLLKSGDEMDEIQRQIRAGETPRPLE